MDVDVTQRTAEHTLEYVTSQPGWRRVVLWVANHELWIVGAVAPALMFPGRFPQPLLFASLAILALVWPLRWLAWKRVTRRTAFDVPILALLLMLPASLYATADFATSLPKVTGILLGVAIFYAVVNSMATRERMIQLTALLILIAVGVAGVSLVATSWIPGKLPLVSRVYQFLPHYTHNLTRSGGFQPNQVGGTLILFIPLMATLLLTLLFARGLPTKDGGSVREESQGGFSIEAMSYLQQGELTPRLWDILWFVLGRRLREHRYVVVSLVAVALLFTSGTLILTQSRSALFGISVALLFLAALRNRWTALAFVVLVVLSLAGVGWVGPATVGHLLLDVTNDGSPVGTLDLAGRQEVWSRAVYMLQDFPYTGIGLGMFNQVAHVLYPFFLIGPDTVVVHAHNVYLQVGVDLGLPGLVAYMGLMTAFCAATWRIGRRAPTSYMRAVGLGLLGGMVAYHIYGLTDAMTLGAKPSAALWAMLGLAAVLENGRWKVEGGKDEVDKEKRQKGDKWVSGGR